MEIPPGQPNQIQTPQTQDDQPVSYIKYILIPLLAVLFVGILGGGAWYLVHINTSVSQDTITELPIITPGKGSVTLRKANVASTSSSSSSVAATAPEAINVGNEDVELQDLQKDLQRL